MFVTGDTNLGHQQDLERFDLAVVLVHPPRLVVPQVRLLIPGVLAAYDTAPKHAVTVVGVPVRRRRG